MNSIIENAPETGAFLGQGCFAQVYEHPTDAMSVLKRTTCAATIELLRELLASGPQPGLPRVLAEEYEEDCGAVWFRLERLYPIVRGSTELQAASDSLSAAERLAERAESTESGLAALFATELRRQGERRLARAAVWLSRFLRAHKGGLDLYTSSNYMKDAAGRLVFADPVSLY